MAISFFNRSIESTVETVAVFGSARLVRRRDGRHELRGGNRNDLINAKEWIALFGHDVILRRSEG